MAGFTDEDELQLELEMAKAKKDAAKARNLEGEVSQRKPLSIEEKAKTVNLQDPKGFSDLQSSFDKTSRGVVGDEAADDAAWQIHKDDVRRQLEGAQFSVPKALGKGLINFSARASNLGMAGIDKAGNLIGHNPELLKNYGTPEENMYHGKNIGESLVMGAGEIGPGVGLGMKAAGLATKAAPSIVKGIGSFLGGNVGSTIGIDKDQDTLLSGRAGLDHEAPIEGEDIDDATLRKSFNLAQDAILTGALTGAVTRTAGWTIDKVAPIVSGLMNWSKQSAVQKEFTQAVVDIASGVDDHSTPEQQQQAYQQIIDYMNAHKDVVESFQDPAIRDINRERDTISVLLGKLDPQNPQEAAVIQELEGFRSSARQGGAPKLNVALEAPRNDLNNTLGQIHEGRGGSDAIDQTRQVVQTGVHSQEAIDDLLPAAAKDLQSDVNNNLDDLITGDPTFGPQLKKSEDVKFDTNKISRDKQSEIVQDAYGIEQKDREVRDAAYKELSDSGAAAKMDEFQAAVEEAKPFLDDTLSRTIEGADGSFGYLNNQVRPRLSDAITAAYASKDVVKARALQKLRDNITNDQVAWLTDQGENSAVENAKKASQANRDYVGKWNDGLGEDLKINSRINRPRTQPRNFIEGGRQTLLGAIKNPNRKESIDQLFDILKNGGSNEDKVADVALAEAFKDISESGVKSLDDAVGKLQGMANAFPPRQQARITKFMQDVKNRKIVSNNIDEYVKQVESETELSRKGLYEDSFKDFFKQNYKGTYDDNLNGGEILDKIFRNPESEAKLGEIVKAVSSNENARKGLQAAWAESAMKMLQNSKDIPMLSEQFKKYGRQVFPENEKIVDIISNLNKEAKNISNQNLARQTNGFDSGGNQARATAAMNGLRTIIFGILNPTSAKLGVISKAFLKNNDSTRVVKEVADDLLSSPSKFIEQIERLKKESLRSVPKQGKKAILRTMTQDVLKHTGTQE